MAHGDRNSAVFGVRCGHPLCNEQLCQTGYMRFFSEEESAKVWMLEHLCSGHQVPDQNAAQEEIQEENYVVRLENGVPDEVTDEEFQAKFDVFDESIGRNPDGSPAASGPRNALARRQAAPRAKAHAKVAANPERALRPAGRGADPSMDRLRNALSPPRDDRDRARRDRDRDRDRNRRAHGSDRRERSRSRDRDRDLDWFQVYFCHV